MTENDDALHQALERLRSWIVAVTPNQIRVQTGLERLDEVASLIAAGRPALDVDQIADAIFDVENFAYSGGPETTEVMERYRESVYEKARAIHARLTAEWTP